MSRTPRFTERYRRNADRLGAVPGSLRGREVGLTIASLARADILPGPSDTRAAVPPTGEAFVRRVQGRNLWLWYRFTPSEVSAIGLTADPPVPLDD